MGDSIKLVGEGLETGRVHQPILSLEQIAELEISPEKKPFDGDASRLRLGIEAMRLGLAYEYDPYFSLSIIIAWIEQSEVIRKILRHLNLWERPQRSPPPRLFPHKLETFVASLSPRQAQEIRAYTDAVFWDDVPVWNG